MILEPQQEQEIGQALETRQKEETDLAAKSADIGKAIAWLTSIDGLKKEIGMTGLGLAFSTGKLKFKKGDFKAMISDPRMAGPFIKSFAAMGRV